MNYATAFQIPTTTELSNRPQGEGGFNPGLRPESMRSLEIGLIGRRREKISSGGFAGTKIRNCDVVELLQRHARRHCHAVAGCPLYYEELKQDFRSWNADRFVTKSSDLYELKNAVNEMEVETYAHAR